MQDIMRSLMQGSVLIWAAVRFWDAEYALALGIGTLMDRKFVLRRVLRKLR